MPQLHSIAVNGTVYELPAMNQLQDLARAMSSIGVSAYDAAQALRRMDEVLDRLKYVENEITALKDSVHDLKCETDNIQSGLNCCTAVLEMELNDLRSAMDAKADKPKQKSDLEIFSPIVWNEDFLKFGDSNMFLN